MSIPIQIRTGNAAVIDFHRRLGVAPDHEAGMGRRLERDE